VKLRSSPTADPTTSAVAAIAAGAMTLGVLAQVLGAAAGFEARFIAASFGLYALASILVVRGLRGHHGHARFGLANCITLMRVVLVCLMAGFTVEHAAGIAVAAPLHSWMLFTLALTAMVLDGFDGLAARRLGTFSGYGARFDMEVDAFQILVLSIAACVLGKAGGWVLASGLMRYAFVAAGALWPPLARPVPFSWRRKGIAVIQGGALTAIMAPLVTPPASGALAVAALALLTYSFAADVRWLIVHRRES
jgi:phosphatidylglycerophosphate synthase